MNQEKYIGYLESQIADTMWPSRTMSRGEEAVPASLPQTGDRQVGLPLTARHSFAMLQAVQKGQEAIGRFVAAGVSTIW